MATSLERAPAPLPTLAAPREATAPPTAKAGAHDSALSTPPSDRLERELSLERSLGGASAPEERADDEPEEVATAPVVREGDRWRNAVEAVKQDSARLGTSLSHARFLGLTPDGVRVAFPPEAGFHRASVFGSSRAAIEQALARAFGRSIRLVEETSPAAVQSAPRSLAEEENSVRQNRERSIETRVREHPAVRAIARVLGGSIEHIQVLEAAPVEAPSTPVVEEDS